MKLTNRIGLIFVVIGIIGGIFSILFVENSQPVFAQDEDPSSEKGGALLIDEKLIFSSIKPEPSIGLYDYDLPQDHTFVELYSRQVASPMTTTVGTTFGSFSYNGWIPPDPIGAVGVDRVLAVINVNIEARSKTGTLLWQDTLKNFFKQIAGTANDPVTATFDPKIVYDHYEDRFVVVTLERDNANPNANPSSDNISKIFVAVSKDGTPASATSSDWWYTVIDAKESIDGVEHWVDYPGFEIDEEAVYITGKMFAHPPGATNFRTRLWIIDKGVVGGFYSGSAASFAVYDPIQAAGLDTNYHSTLMPALIYGTGGAGSGVGTYLVSYSGWSDGTNEYVQVIRGNTPLATPTFTNAFILVGNLEDFGGPLPDAPQSGSTAIDIETNDQRSLDAVWRNNALWFTATIEPRSGPDAGETTAHWFKLNTTSWPPILSDQGNIGGEDIASDTYTFFPSLAVNNDGDVMFSFSASANSIYVGAYCTGREAGDPAGTVQGSQTVKAGIAEYQRTDSIGRNRWGDYTGMALDPTNENHFWSYNEYAIAKGSGVSPEDGRWATQWAICSFEKYKVYLPLVVK